MCGGGEHHGRGGEHHGRGGEHRRRGGERGAPRVEENEAVRGKTRSEKPPEQLHAASSAALHPRHKAHEQRSQADMDPLQG